MEKKHLLFISPHLDDAVLSCGGYIGKLCALRFPVDVLTVFSGSPSGKLSILAKKLHADWRLPKDAPAVRREEDLKALGELGAKAIHAGFLDCIYRRDPLNGKALYTRLSQIMDQNLAAETDLIDALCEYLIVFSQKREYTHIFSPLALGGHIDHLIVHAAVRKAQKKWSGAQLHFYEDLPYAIQDAADDARTMGMRHYVCTQDAGFAQKYDAMAQYASQIKCPDYPGGIDIDAIVQYGSEQGAQAGTFAERIWTVR